MIYIYTDGSNVHNGKSYSYGGYGYIIEFMNECFEGGSCMPVNSKDPVTNNKAELLAIIDALDFIVETCVSQEEIHIYSDSQWCVMCGNKEWGRKKNINLWMKFDKIMNKCKRNGNEVELKWIKGHAGHEMNERVDKLAKSFCKAAKNKDGC